ncbi:phospholipase D-like domain-containing protein [Candidatus Paracaedibacter symbiosus]|uniref:phospholipase D-like domain-containing protein n=1 Tax=Candidatus Paracaedibacter symbiosus TaxID=244582 RepID=UPI001E42ECC7|nr:phospholipase D-like domain-containing protein [Candidatus Paracaedibacter symbiosus]
MAILSFGATAAPPPDWHDNAVFVMPDVGRKTWINAINNAEETIHMAAYKLSDPAILDSLKKAHERNVKINLLIEDFIFEHAGSSNVKSPIEAFKEFATVYTLPKRRFNQAHSKMIVVDKEWGLISTGNLDAESFDGIPEKNIPAARDFAVPILQIPIIDEMLRVFVADVNDKDVTPENRPLVFGPDHQRNTFLSLFNKAQREIKIYQQDFQDKELAEAACRAAKSGVKVQVLMMPFPFGKEIDRNIPNQNLMKEAGVDIGLFEKLYVHAKIIIVDGKEMYLGSGNFYTPAIDGTRELGILIENPEQIAIVEDQFEKDWAQATINPDRH